jgi:hypothetical protein
MATEAVLNINVTAKTANAEAGIKRFRKTMTDLKASVGGGVGFGLGMFGASSLFCVGAVGHCR